jgi:hypothetical protein
MEAWTSRLRNVTSLTSSEDRWYTVVGGGNRLPAAKLMSSEHNVFSAHQLRSLLR